MTNLLRDSWVDDWKELRIALNERVGGPGQFDDRVARPNLFCLPVAGDSCRIVLTFKNKRICAIEAGPAFDAAWWDTIAAEIDRDLARVPMTGRDFSFSTFRVVGYWRGRISGIQLLQAPDGTPRADPANADHPFILEFPVDASDSASVTNYRRLRQHRRLTFLLNVLLRGHLSVQPPRSVHFWAAVPGAGNIESIKWVRRAFYAALGDVIIDQPSTHELDALQEIEPGNYYAMVGNDGAPLRVPSDLDSSISAYQQLAPIHQRKFDRAAYWLELASQLWSVSVSGSFAALVSSVEALTTRGERHRARCEECGKPCTHEVPGATRNFRDFLDRYAPEVPKEVRDFAVMKRSSDIYALRSNVLHGSDLMELDEDLSLGFNPPEWKERELHSELWSVTKRALRNWLADPI